MIQEVISQALKNDCVVSFSMNLNMIQVEVRKGNLSNIQSLPMDHLYDSKIEEVIIFQVNTILSRENKRNKGNEGTITT